MKWLSRWFASLSAWKTIEDDGFTLYQRNTVTAKRRSVSNHPRARVNPYWDALGHMGPTTRESLEAMGGNPFQLVQPMTAIEKLACHIQNHGSADHTARGSMYWLCLTDDNGPFTLLTGNAGWYVSVEGEFGEEWTPDEAQALKWLEQLRKEQR